MKKLLFLFVMIPLIGFGQVQNSKLAQNLLLSVQSGANSMPGVALTSGSLEVGGVYTIGNYLTNDDFTNVGAASNASGVTFTATGTTPTHWAHSSLLRKRNVTALTTPNPAYSMTNTGAIPTYGHKGNSSYLSFDGVDDVVTIPHATSLSFSGDYSVRIRLKTGPTVSGGGVLWKGGTSSTNREYTFYINTGKFYFATTKAEGGYYTTSSDIVANTWYTFIATFSGTTMTLYKDATAETPTTFSGTRVTGTNDITVGNITGLSDYFNGGINQINFWNYALDQTAVTYYSNPANHLKAVDQGATGAELITATADRNFSSDTGWWVKNAGVTIADSVCHFNTAGNVALYKGGIITDGKDYNIKFSVKNYSSGGIKFFGGTIKTGNVTQFSEKVVDPGGAVGWESYPTAVLDIDDVSVIQAGCLLDLTAEGMISPTLWRDYYHNVDIALTGTTAPRLVKSNLTAWRFDGTTSYMTGVDMSGSGKVYAGSMWLYFPSAITTSTVTQNIADFSTSYAGIQLGALSGSYSDELITIGVYDNCSYYALNGGTLSQGWHHLLFNWTGAKYQIYLDGIALTTSVYGTPVLLTPSIFYFGEYHTSSGKFNGVIEGFSIYKNFLSAEQIALSYTSYQE